LFQIIKNYCPGDKAKIKIQTTDSESGKAIKTILGITVTDESVLESIEKRKQNPRLNTQVYLEKEVDHLEDANIYLNNNDPKSELAIDLLLGTQGWRRFSFMDFDKFLLEKLENGERIGVVHPGKKEQEILSDEEISDDDQEEILKPQLNQLLFGGIGNVRALKKQEMLFDNDEEMKEKRR